MSIGGTVTETIDCATSVWINTLDDHGEYCAIHVKPSNQAFCISEGDTVWWQAGWALWTPKGRRGNNILRDVKLERIGYSGAKRPEAPPQSRGYHAWAEKQEARK